MFDGIDQIGLEFPFVLAWFINMMDDFAFESAFACNIGTLVHTDLFCIWFCFGMQCSVIINSEKWIRPLNGMTIYAFIV